MKIICSIILIVLTNFVQAEECINESLWIEKYSTLITKMKPIKNFSSLSKGSDFFGGTAEFNKLIPKVYTLSYNFEYGSESVLILAFDIQKSEVFLTQYSEGGKLQNAPVLGDFLDNSCDLVFSASDTEKVILNYSEKVTYSFQVKIDEKGEFTETFKLIFSN